MNILKSAWRFLGNENLSEDQRIAREAINSGVRYSLPKWLQIFELSLVAIFASLILFRAQFGELFFGDREAGSTMVSLAQLLLPVIVLPPLILAKLHRQYLFIEDMSPELRQRYLSALKKRIKVFVTVLMAAIIAVFALIAYILASK